MKKIFYFLLVSTGFYVYGQSYFGHYSEIYHLLGLKNAFENKELDSLNSFNYNPIINVSSLQDFHLKNKFKEKGTLFLVFEAYSKEHFPILEIKDSKNSVIVSNLDVLGLSSEKTAISSDKGAILSYTFVRNSYSRKNNNLSFFTDYSYQENPIKIMELIYFPTLVNNIEEEKIKTYLSIKYGISLDKEANYIISTNDTVWSKKDNDNFIHRITGIGRDDSFGLYQKKSYNSQKDGLSIGISNGEYINENSFFLWGDNGLSMEFSNSDNNKFVYTMERIWKTNGYGKDLWNLEFTIDYKKLLTDNNEILEEDSGIFWMVKNDLPFFDLESDYIKQTSLKDNTAVFDMVRFDKLRSENEYFTFIKAPEFFALYECIRAECNDNNPSLNIRAVGGTAPYNVAITSEAETEFYEFENSLFHIENLMFGTVHIRITDKQGYYYDFSIDNKPVEPIDIEMNEKWLTTEGKPIEIFPIVNNDTELHFEWSYNGEIVSESSSFSTYKEGFYTLKVIDAAGCEKEYPFEVIHTNNTLNDVILYPNQSFRGEKFNLKFRLEESQEIDIFICDMSGKLLKHSKITATQDFIYTDSIPVSGAYAIIIRSEHLSTTKTLLVK